MNESEHFDVICHESERHAWLSNRCDYVGASETPALLAGIPGFDFRAFGSPSSIAATKMGLSDGAEENRFMKWGRLLEPVILEELGPDMSEGSTDTYAFEPYGWLLRSKRWPWLSCTPDGRAIGNEDLFAQVKNTLRASDWDEAVPPRVNVQCQHEMAVTGSERCVAAGLLQWSDLRWDWIERDDKMIEEVIVPVTREFWEAVSAGNPWQVDGHDATTALMKELYPEAVEGKSIALDATHLPPRFDGDWRAFDAEWVEAADNERKWKAKRGELKNIVRDALEDAEIGETPQGVIFTNSNVHKNAYEVKASDYRMLTRKAPKQ